MTDFQWTKSQFYVPEGMTYLDGNSLGPLPLNAKERVGASMIDQWGEMLVTGWNKAGWMDMPRRVGDRIAQILGAASGSIVMGDTLSIKVYQALSSALDMRPDRRVILSDTGNFPSDLYMAEGLIKSLDRDYELRVVAPEDVYDAIDNDVAVTLITEIDYRTGRRHDMQAITERAHACGAITVWDLAHSAGAVDVDLAGANVDFAIGCTYKYLNGGPGAPAFIYVRPDLADVVRPALSGWLGHAAPFDFELNYRAGDGIDRLRVGTPPILGLIALDAALDVWDHVDIADVCVRAIELSEAFVEEVSAGCPALKLASPSDPHARGSQVSYHFEQGYAAMQAMIDRKIIGDFRAPDLMRFGFAPLYIDIDQVREAARTLCDVINLNLWDDPKYKTRHKVT
ncbi:MAG: kynureninase [Paracoccaceae bacterium]